MITKHRVFVVFGIIVIAGVVIWAMATPTKAPIEVKNQFSQKGVLSKESSNGKADVWRLNYGQSETKELDFAGVSVSGIESGMDVHVFGMESMEKILVSDIEVINANKDDLIWVVTPLPNHKEISSPLTITGFARGNWYFEASFPVKLFDGNGNLLVQAPAQAQGEWMTTRYVPFTIALNFVQPATADGTLVLEKDNPSGLPENANELRIPIRFKLPN